MADKGISLRVLGYKDEDEWVAHCLEMDLRGFGASFKEAFSELRDLVRMQVGFALQKKELGLLNHPAHHRYFALFERLSCEALERFPKPIESKDPHRISNIPLPAKSETLQFVAHA